jgi:HEAT repeat protein
LDDDQAEAERDLTIRCAREMNRREYLPRIRGCLQSTNEAIRIAAIVTVGEWNDEESRTLLQEFAQSDHLRTQRAARSALSRLDAARRNP